MQLALQPSETSGFDQWPPVGISDVASLQNAFWTWTVINYLQGQGSIETNDNRFLGAVKAAGLWTCLLSGAILTAFLTDKTLVVLVRMPVDGFPLVHSHWLPPNDQMHEMPPSMPAGPAVCPF